MAYLETNHGVKTLVDEDIKKSYSHIRFYLNHGYVTYRENGHTKRLHRLVIGATDDQEVDHISRDKLDNRRENLRICNRSDNLKNRNPYGKVKVKHVTWAKDRSKYRASVWLGNNKRRNLGYYSDLKEAAKAVEKFLCEA